MPRLMLNDELWSKLREIIGKSVAGNTTKIHMAVDACGFPIAFQLTGGEVHDAKVAPEFIKNLPIADYTIADRGYDSEEIREQIKQKSSIPVIPRNYFLPAYVPRPYHYPQVLESAPILGCRSGKAQ